MNSLTVALDMSCAAETPMTGVGYAALFQIQALARLHPELDLRIFATGDRHAVPMLSGKIPSATREAIYGHSRLLKYYAWTRFSWPPIEWFSGPARIAHNLCHQTPAASKAVRVVTVHDLSCYRVPETHTPRTIDVQKTLLRQCAREADIIVTVSEHCKQEMMDILNVPADRIRAIPNGVDNTEFAEDFGPEFLSETLRRIGVSGPYFIHLGTIEPRKNLVRLIAAYVHARERFPDLPALVLAGKRGWKSESTFDAIETQSRNGSVLHAGYLSRREAVALLKGAHACLYPSLYEGFGLPVLEAMAAGTPVLTASSSSLPEVAGSAAVYVDPLSTESIMEGICTMWKDSNGNANRSAMGLKRAYELTWDASARQLAACYREIA
ncbi:MAG: glycosyl transferase [Candidatus Hydrogenedentota bacterium]